MVGVMYHHCWAKEASKCVAVVYMKTNWKSQIQTVRINTVYNLRTFYEKLITEGNHPIESDTSHMTYFSGSHALRDYRAQYGGTVFELFSDTTMTEFKRSTQANHIMSVGSAEAHDQARRCSMETGHSYVTCPIPLANDSFSTDRVLGSVNCAAFKTQFPCIVVLDWDLCRSVGVESNVFGLGEAIGLITSMRDFVKTMERNDGYELISFVDSITEDLLLCWTQQETPTQRLRIPKLAAYLSVKGLLIQLLGTNTPIASCDHLVAYELSLRGFEWPHGKLVLAGVLLTLPLVHDYSESEANRLMKLAIETKLLTPANVHRILRQDIADILKAAPARRPRRNTSLRGLKDKDRETAADCTRSVLKDYE